MNDSWIGKTIGGCRLESLIGKGAMGAIYLAHQLQLDRKVAVKLLSSNLSSTTAEEKQNSIQRFQQEARLAAKLQHPNVVQIYDFGEEDGTYYIVMQYIEGQNLDEVLKKDGLFSVKDCLHILKEVTKALEAAYQQKIIHRDIKPANIMIRKDKSIVVTDFGLAKSMHLFSGLSVAGDCIGTLGYMSPEQASGHTNIDHRSDIYSLGASIFHLITGHCPFEGANPVEIIYKQVSAVHPAIQEFRKDVPVIFSKIIDKMMEREYQKRFQTPKELLNLLESLEKKGVFSLQSLNPPSQRIRAKGRSITHILPASLMPGEEKVGKLLEKALHLQDSIKCQAEGCTQEWSVEDISNKKAILFEQQVWCPLCLWNHFTYTMANAKVGKCENVSFGEYWLAIRRADKFMPEEPIRWLYRFPLKRQKKGWDIMLKRIERGFSLVYKIHSPVLLRVGCYAECAENDFSYVPMEYIPGTTLDRLLEYMKKERQPLTMEEIIVILRKVAQGLITLHENNIVHRNVTPHSIYLSLSGGIRLGNFTMAKSFSSQQPVTVEKNPANFKEYCMEYWKSDENEASGDITTNPNCALGTLSYMSPEQTVSASTVGQQSDIWSWGMIAYELVEGKKPFSDDNAWSAVQAIRQLEALKFDRDVPVGFQKIIHTALQKDLQQRYQNAEEIVKALDLLKL